MRNGGESEEWLYTGFMAGRPPKNNPTDHGKHLADLRKAAGLSQTEVANTLGVPQRTVSFYERAARQVPRDLVKPLADLYGVPAEEILGIEGPEPQKRGPKTKLERLMVEVRKLPRTKQDFIAKLVGQILTAETGKAWA